MQRLYIALMLTCCIPTAAVAVSALISKSQLKDAWPLTVNSGTLNCEPVPGALNVQIVTFIANGKTYALNGIARGHAKRHGWRESREIWKDNPTIPGTKVNIGPLIDRGLALCK